MSVLTGVNEQVFDTTAGEWPITHATIFDTQAEIRRSLTLEVKTPGANLIKLRGLPNKINPASIRAAIPTKNARLIEVAHDTVLEEGKPDKEIAELLENIRVIQLKQSKTRERLNFRKNKIEKHQQAILGAIRSDAIEEKQHTLDSGLFKKVNNALDFYDKMKVKLQESYDQLAEEEAKTEAERVEAQIKQNKLSMSKNIQVASILLDIPEEVMKMKQPHIEVNLFYLVSGAYWAASYDIRAEKGVDKATLTYYGQVVNATEEDWVEVEMSLSTAKPSIGGALPPLARKQVDFASIYRGARKKGGFGKSKALKSLPMKNPISKYPVSQKSLNFPFSKVQDRSSAVEAPLPAEFEMSTTIASGDTGSTLFKIQRLANIDSDSKRHRQTIAIIELDALFTHAVSPKVSKNVFLKCTTRNTSPYPFLPGKLGVFIDGSFVSDSEMNLVRSNEEFGLYLGIDDSVRLNYAPAVEKEKTIGGGLGRTKRRQKVITREIALSNNGPTPINCCIFEQLPLSKQGKIKIDLRKPEMSKKYKNVNHKINESNNLESRTTITPGQKFEMVFEYQMEWPEYTTVEIVQRRAEGSS